MAEKKVTGPASYFPSIEKKYGKPIEHWMKELKKVSKLAHMEQVAHLKEKFEMGHGPFEDMSFRWAVTSRNPDDIPIEFFCPKT
jgi:urocanate hydratase